MSLVQPSADPTPVVVRMFPDWGGCSGLWGDGGALDEWDSPQAARDFLVRPEFA